MGKINITVKYKEPGIKFSELKRSEVFEWNHAIIMKCSKDKGPEHRLGQDEVFGVVLYRRDSDCTYSEGEIISIPPEARGFPVDVDLMLTLIPLE